MYSKYYYIYDIKERLNDYADDSELDIDHISFLIDEVRALVIKQSYLGIGTSIPKTILQQVNLTLELNQDNEFADVDKVLVSNTALPRMIESGNINKFMRIDNGSYKDIKFVRVPNERFPYTGYNKFLRQFMYYTLGNDYKLYFNGQDPVHRLIENVRVFAPFENPKTAWEAGPDYDSSVDFNDVIYPIDSDMWVKISDMIFKMLRPKLQVPEDKINDATD